MLEGMSCTEIMATGHFRMWGIRQAWRWGAGRGVRISGISITMGTPTYMWRMDICRGHNEMILQVFSGGRWSQNPLRMPLRPWRMSVDGMQSISWFAQTTRGTALLET